MPLAGFSVIEQYRNLAKDLEQEPAYDQEVPQYREDLDMKPFIKMEAEESHPDIYSLMLLGSSGISDNHHNGSNCNIYTDTAGDGYRHIYTSDSCARSSPSPSPYLSTSPAPMLSSTPTTLPGMAAVVPQVQPMSTIITTANNSSFITSKTTTYVSELGGSGCTVMSNSDFSLSEATSCALPPVGMQDDSLEYTDLDKQPTSLYDDLEPFSGSLKSSVDSSLSDESNSIPLEEAAILMRNVIQNDCDRLSIPYDPLTWTPEQVNKWLAWVCEKNNVPDVSSQLYGLDGQSLCSIHPETFSVNYGNSGISISNELELWKAANSCFPNHTYGPNISDVSMHPPQHLHNPYMESPQTFSLAPCVSPAPSTCSSIHDSSGSSGSTTHSDHSDDESGYSSISSHPSSSGDHSNFRGRLTAKMPTGRGHKQTIHLWQFLKEMLISKENHTDCIRWLDRKSGIFKIEDSKKVAHLWGARKNRPAMNYDKLSRSVRQYYKKGIIKKTEQSKRLVYQFCPEYL